MSSEVERVLLLRRVLEGEGAPPGETRVGIGDDAAVLAGDLVWTVDAQVEGTHFRLDWMSWEDVGWRSVMAAASDLAAMAADPVAALASLVLAPSVDDAALEAIARGQAAASRELALPVVGGNLAGGRETSLTTTVLGRAPRPVLRSGARPGDVVWCAGPLGLAAAGLRLLERGLVAGADGEACLAAFRRLRARLAAGRALRGRASSALDVSDGLAGDAAHLARASGVTIAIEEGALRASLPGPLGPACAALGDDPRDVALQGGEDYAVLATAPADVDLGASGFARLGHVRGDEGGAPVVLVQDDGHIVPLQAAGFDHFRG